MEGLYKSFYKLRKGFLNTEIQVYGVGMSHHDVKDMTGNKAVLGAVMAEWPVEIN
jgi:hypothetical protein